MGTLVSFLCTSILSSKFLAPTSGSHQNNTHPHPHTLMRFWITFVLCKCTSLGNASLLSVRNVPPTLAASDIAQLRAKKGPWRRTNFSLSFAPLPRQPSCTNTHTHTHTHTHTQTHAPDISLGPPQGAPCFPDGHKSTPAQSHTVPGSQL